MKSWMTKSGQKIDRVLWGRCNCFLVSNGKKHLLVDTGRESKWKELSDRLDCLGVELDSLDAVILTHSHFDHAENAANIKEKYKTVLIIHKDEADYLKQGHNAIIRGTTVVTKLLTDIAGQKSIDRFFRFKPAEYDLAVESSHDLRLLGFNGYLIHTPGHSPGSLSVVIDDEIALVGDAMFGVFKGSVFPPFATDPEMTIKNWSKLLETGCSIFLPAHGSAQNRELLQQQYEKYKIKYGQ